VTGHPLDRYADKISELATHDSSSLEGLAKGTELSLCGVLTSIVRKRNKEGKPWATLTLEDRSGSIEALVFATSYERLAAQVVEDEAVMVKALALPEDSGQVKVSVQDILPLENARVDFPAVISVRVWLGRNGQIEPGKAEALGELFRRKPGQTQVRLRLESPRDFSVLLDIADRVRPDKEFRAQIEQLCGPDALERVAG
jgi:DNA polymerase-3 subunit alpha